MNENKIQEKLELIAKRFNFTRQIESLKEKRLEDIGKFRLRGFTLQKIADEVGVTRERVRQILLTHPDDEVRKKNRIFERIPNEERMCPQCHDVFTCRPIAKTKYCSRECRKLAPKKWKNKKEYNKAKYEHTKMRYQTDPDYRKAILTRYRNWVKKREEADPSLREHRLQVMREQALKRKEKKNQERYKKFNELKQRGLPEQLIRGDTKENPVQ